MNLFKATARSLFLLLGMSAAHAGGDSSPVLVDFLETCHTGLLVWQAMPPGHKCGYVQTPQVKIFDGGGRLRFVEARWMR